jgi:hypothetical protein
MKLEIVWVVPLVGLNSVLYWLVVRPVLLGVLSAPE